MSPASADARVFECFAALLEYPGEGVAVAAEECALHLAARSPEAAGLLQRFAEFARSTPRTRLEEIYTGLFELDASHHPYVGYHLFGESYKRSEFLVALKARYRAHEIDCGVELPDHLAAVLRFLAVTDDAVEAEELMRDALRPTLGKLLKREASEVPEAPSPAAEAVGREYQGVLEALSLWLHVLVPGDEADGGAESDEARLVTAGV